MNQAYRSSTSKIASYLALLLLAAFCLLPSGCRRDPKLKKQQYFQSGNLYLQQGKYPEAAIQFQNAIQIDKDFVEGHSQLAKCFLHQGRWAEAYNELALTVQLDPKNSQAQLDLANLFFSAHQFQEARAHAERVLEADPDLLSAQLLLANSDAALGNIDTALQEARHAVELAPDKPAPYLCLGALQEKTHQLAEAERSFEKAISLDPKFLPARLGLGGFYQRQQRWAEAEAEYRTGVGIAPDEFLARAALASFYFAWGKKDVAEQTLVEAKNFKPNDPTWYRLLGDFYLLSNDTQKALSEFTALREAHPGDLNLKKLYIELLVQTKDLDQATQLNEEILKQNPKDADALTLKGQILNLSKASEAVPILEAAIRSNPEAALAHYQLGIAYAKAGNLQSAEKEWRTAVQLKRSLLEAQQELANLALQHEDMELLGRCAAAWIDTRPDAPQGYILRSTVKLKAGDVPGAETDAKKAISLDSKNPAAYTRLGDVRLSQKRADDAQHLYEQALQLNPRALEPLTRLVSISLYQKQPGKALQQVRAQIDKAPDYPPFHLLLGELLMSQHNAAEAQAEFAKVVALDASNLQAVFLLAQAQQQTGEIAAAAATYERVLQQNPKNIDACIAFGILEEHRGNWEHAETLYRQALDLQPTQPAAANNLSYLILEHGGDLKSALSLAQTARRGMPDSANSADTLAWAYYKNGMYGSAIDLLKEAAKKAPENPTYYYHLGLAYQRSNQVQLAKTNLQHALVLDPKSPRAEEIRQALTELTSN